MKDIKAWIVIDTDEKPLLVSEKIPIFWLKKQAVLFSKNVPDTKVLPCLIKL